MANCLDTLFERVIVGDGDPALAGEAAGLGELAFPDAAALDQPDAVTAAYEFWLEAGAQLIRTQSRRANGWELAQHGLDGRVSEVNWKAARLAADAAKGRGVFVAGCVMPVAAQAGGSPEERRGWYRDQMGALFDGGADSLVLEGFAEMDELLLAVDVYHNLTNKPLVPVVDVPEHGGLSGLWDALRDADAEITGMAASSIEEALRRLAEVRVGIDDATAVSVPFGTDPAADVQALVNAGAHLVLGGSGTSPAAIRTAVAAAKEMAPVRHG